eukprot:15438067-Alexandrium_andersonii.AAC.1
MLPVEAQRPGVVPTTVSCSSSTTRGGHLVMRSHVAREGHACVACAARLAQLSPWTKRSMSKVLR